MKKTIAIVMAALLALCCVTAFAESTDIQTSYEGGAFTVRIPVEGEDQGWLAEAEGDAVVTLAASEVADGAFTARFEAVADGEVTVSVRHYYTGFACDQAHTWDLKVEGGAVTETTGGSYTANSDDAELDPVIVGAWVAEGAQLTVEKNPERGWDVEITSAEGAYIFKTTIYQDCLAAGCVYDKGKFWDMPETEGAELGEAATTGTTGAFTFGGEEGAYTLTWHDDTEGFEDIVFAQSENA